MLGLMGSDSPEDKYANARIDAVGAEGVF